MNEKRRKAIMDAVGKVSEARAELEALRDEEQEYFDKMPENMQGAEKGEKAQEAIDAIQTAIDEFESAEGNITDAVQS